MSDQDDRAAEFVRLATLTGSYVCRSLSWQAVSAGLASTQDIVVVDPAVDILPVRDIEDRFGCKGMTVLAVLGEKDERRPGIFSSGFRDYIVYPFVAAEIAVRLDSALCLRGLARGLTVQPLSDPILPANVSSTPPLNDVVNAQERALVDATCCFLSRDIAAHLDLDTLARRMGSNRNTLSRAFRHVLGKGVYAWLRHVRLDAAAHLLKATDRSVQSISFDVGYEDPANFATAFRQVHGRSPSAFRKAMRNSKE